MSTGTVKGYLRCAFTGYRPQKLPFGFDERSEACVRFRRELAETIERLTEQGYAHFISGGALGMDMFAAEEVLRIKQRCPWIMLEMVSPFDGQSARWAPEYVRRHERLFREADKVTCTGHVYTRGCMYRRNRYLVENADLLLAAYNGQPGGTAMTVAYADELGIPVQIFWPT